MKRLLFLMAIAPSPLHATSLEDAQTLAIEASPRLKTLKAEIRESEERARSASWIGRPVIGIAGGAQFEGNDDEQDLLPLAYGYMTYNLFNGNQAELKQKLAINETKSLEMALPFEERELRLKIKDIYLDIASKRLQIELLRKEKTSFDRLKKQASQRKNAGLIGEADVLEFDLKTTDLDTEIESLKVETQSDLNRLSALTLKSIEPTGFSLPSIAPAGEESNPPGAASTLSLRRLENERVRMGLEKSVREAQWKPQVDIETRAGRLPSEGDLDKHKPRFDALVIAKWDLFTSGQQRALQDESRARSQRLEASLNENLQASELLRKELIEKLKATQLRAEIQARRKTPAQKYFSAMMDEYNRGIKNSPDVAHAAETVHEIDRKLLELRYQWAKLSIEIEKIMNWPR